MTGTSGTSGTTGQCNVFVAAAILALLVQSAHVAAQQAPPRDARTTPSEVNAAPTGSGVVAGSVTTAEDNRPIRFAYVVLIGTTTGIVKVSSTDADGRFTFANLPDDRYTVGVSKLPYLGMIAGAKRPGRTGTPIAIVKGQKVADVSVRMPMGGAISGAIVDERGQPGVGVMVALQQARMQGGERMMLSRGVAVTDDRGHYRFHGLVPGDYVVSALRTGIPPTQRVLTIEDVDAALRGLASTSAAPPPPFPSRYAPVFFPGTTRAADAGLITLGLAEERANVDFRLESVQTSRLEGIISTTDGQPISDAVVIITTPSDSVLAMTMSVRAGKDGRFALPNALPGTHIIIVNGSGQHAGQFARAIVESAGSDVTGIHLVMRPALSFSGQLAFEGASPPSISGRRMPVRVLGAGALFPQVGLTNAKGVFTVSNVMPGRFVVGGPLALGPTQDTMNWALHSVIVDGKDLTDLPFEIADTAPGSVVVTYTDKWQELSGRLQSQSGAPVSDHTILVFPEDKAYWISGSRRIVIARPGTDGRFTLSGRGPTTLPPGRYLLAAVTDIGRDEQFDPAFLAQIVPAAIPIALGPGERKVQDLAIK